MFAIVSLRKRAWDTATGSELVFSTCLGGDEDKNIIGKHDIATDPSGNIYVTGRTSSDYFQRLDCRNSTGTGDPAGAVYRLAGDASPLSFRRSAGRPVSFPACSWICI